LVARAHMCIIWPKHCIERCPSIDVIHAHPIREPAWRDAIARVTMKWALPASIAEQGNFGTAALNGNHRSVFQVQCSLVCSCRTLLSFRSIRCALFFLLIAAVSTLWVSSDFPLALQFESDWLRVSPCTAQNVLHNQFEDTHKAKVSYLYDSLLKFMNAIRYIGTSIVTDTIHRLVPYTRNLDLLNKHIH
jgi:hypothetical protein